MAIDPDALKRFLNRQPEPLPRFKGADPAWLREQIVRSIGRLPRFKTEPRPPQLEGLAAALYLRRALLFYEMRLGKTKMGFDFAQALRDAGLFTRKGIVVAHSALGVSTWETQAAIHTDLKVQGIRTDKQSMALLLACLEDDTDLVVIAWPTLQQLFSLKRPNRKGKPKLYPDHVGLRMLAEFFQLCIFDEIHTCMNHLSLRFAIGRELVAECDYRLGMTGTAIGRDQFDIWPQAFLIDEGETLGKNYFFFERAFGKPKMIKLRGRDSGFKQGQTFDETKLPILIDKLSSFSISYLLSEVQKVEILPGTIKLPMGAEQSKAYWKLVEEEREIDPDDADGRTSLFMKKRQVSAGFLPFQDGDERRIVFFDHNPKMAWLSEFLDEVPDDLQFLIFYEFTPIGGLLHELLASKKIAHGWLRGANAAGNERDVKAFQAGSKQVLVSQSQVGSMSLDLPMADYILFFQSPISSITRAQCEARPLSRGSKPLVIDDLLVGPTEERILAFVKEGKGALRDLVFEPGGSYAKNLKKITRGRK